MKNDTLIPIGIAVVIVLAIVGGYFFPQVTIPQNAGTSPQGSTFSAAKFAGVAVNLASPGANATSSSVLNPTGQDVYITGLKIGCQNVGTSNTAYSGTGLASLTLKVSTTSTAAPAAVGTNLVGGGTLTIATGTASFVLSSTTAAGSSGNGTNNQFVVWGAGTYLTFQTNATNTATCTFGADYFSS